MIDDDLDPQELIRSSYHDLEGLVEPLRELLRVNPRLASSILRLAMVYGIYAEQRRLLDDQKRALVADLDAGLKRWEGFR